MKRWNKTRSLAVLGFVCALWLAACDGDNLFAPDFSDWGGGAATDVGVFKDSNVSGLSYVSGRQTGVTGPDGSFTYEIGRIVTFSVGRVTIGTTSGQSVITPVDLVVDGNTNSV